MMGSLKLWFPLYASSTTVAFGSERCIEKNQFWMYGHLLLGGVYTTLELAGLKAAGLAMFVEKLFWVVRKVAGTGPPAGMVWLSTPKRACGALMPSCALPTRLK